MRPPTNLPPIAPPEPTAAVQITPPGHTSFRMRFWPAFALGVISISVDIPVLGLIMYPGLSRLPGLSADALWRIVILFLSLMLIYNVVWCAIWTSILCRRLQTTVNVESLGAASFWGLKRSAKWEAMVAVRRWNFPFAPYLSVTTQKRRRVLWVPLTLVHQAEFEAKVRELAPPGNPLRVYFEEHPSTSVVQDS